MKKYKNKNALKEAMNIFYPNDKLKKEECLDFMGCPFDEFNVPSLHHIEKASTLREKGLDDAGTLDNCACLGEYSHQALHIIEGYDKKLYDMWNDLFKRINRTRKEFDNEFMDEITILKNHSIEVIDEYNRRVEEKNAKRSKKRVLKQSNNQD